MKKIITNSSAKTKKLGEFLAKQILKKGPQDHAFIIGLIGELGSGKTTFLQGLAKELHIRNRILSPTFVIFKRFKITKMNNEQRIISNQGLKNFYHIDCYRIEKPKELLDLGFADMCQNPENIIAIEWADRIKKILPRQVLIMKFRFLDKNKREVRIMPYPTVDNFLLTRFFNQLKLNKIK